MNRPRNRQPRPPRNNNDQRNHQRSHPNRGTQLSSNMPTTQQVIPGASVSIILKVDQPTGKEVQGIVQDLLTRGNHPRGIKVRLQDGRVGRVQRMANGQPAATTFDATSVGAAVRQPPNSSMSTDTQGSTEPPPRSLGHFLPGLGDVAGAGSETLSDRIGFKTATVNCPFCDEFEGDETAVSHHVQQHLT